MIVFDFFMLGNSTVVISFYGFLMLTVSS